MNKIHLEFLSNLRHRGQKNVGRNALKFGNKIINNLSLSTELNKVFDRQSLIHFCVDKNNSEIDITVAILAWGGMRFDHGRNLMRNWNHLEAIIFDLRNKNISTRKDAFKEFQEIRAQGKLPGLGVGYFTKLICFVNRDLNGYILDQWTGKSINFLWDDSLIKISKSGWITDKNTPENYEEFCQRIEQLSIILNCSSLEAEERIFSNGGRNPGEWRKYLKSNY
jgi:hypothetical protein